VNPVLFVESVALSVHRMVTTIAVTILLCIQTIMYTASVADITEEETES
jgi:hypothetical protein